MGDPVDVGVRANVAAVNMKSENLRMLRMSRNSLKWGWRKRRSTNTAVTRRQRRYAFFQFPQYFAGWLRNPPGRQNGQANQARMSVHLDRRMAK